MSEDCIFCKIVNKEIPSAILYEDEDVIVFPDISPTAPVHLLVVTRKHIPSLQDLTAADAALVGKMTLAANKLAQEQGVAERGYRLVINCGPEGGQVVPHLHMHLLGGRELQWGH